MNLSDTVSVAGLTALGVYAFSSFYGVCGETAFSASGLTSLDLAIASSACVALLVSLKDTVVGNSGKIMTAIQLVGVPVITSAALAFYFDSTTVYSTVDALSAQNFVLAQECMCTGLSALGEISRSAMTQVALTTASGVLTHLAMTVKEKSQVASLAVWILAAFTMNYSISS